MKARQILKKLETEHSGGTTAERFLANVDLLPVTDDKKTWDHFSYVRVY